ncbi:glycosyltransferase family 4 protein [candidate division KSB1 bacterium]|nr:glycosyltransferase family 4 protein [candidate division KSB1 bacterium]
MNIAYISADFGVPIFGYKGASIHVREMVAALRKAGHTVCIISPAIEKTAGERLDESVALLPVPAAERHLLLSQELEALDEFLDMKTRVRQELRNLLYNLTLYEKARDYLRANSVDFIYERYTLFAAAGIRLAREFGVPHILEVNAPLAYEQEKTRGMEMKALAAETERRIFREAGRVIVVSRQLQEFVISCGVPSSRIQILPNSVDPQRFAKARGDRSVRTRHQLDGKRVIGFVGSLKPWHGTETLLEAFRALHATAANAHLLIVGDGPERAHLENFAQTHGLNGAVTFTGNVPYDDIPRYIAAMDIAVAPYIPSENFYYSPIKIFEYMAMGKPVVGGKIGQVEEVINDGETGVLFEPGNIAALQAALAQLANDSPLCRRLGENARAWVETERTWDNNARQVIEMARALFRKKE